MYRMPLRSITDTLFKPLGKKYEIWCKYLETTYTCRSLSLPQTICRNLSFVHNVPGDPNFFYFLLLHENTDGMWRLEGSITFKDTLLLSKQ